MTPVIRISDELYERLGQHSAGFETPSNVIEKLLNNYEINHNTDSTDKLLSNSHPHSDEPSEIIKLAFESTFKGIARPFGQKTSPNKGYSDDNNGVQWNININQDTGHSFLGVNLEGMTYKNWPISKLLLTEKNNPQLPNYSQISESNEIIVGLTRDAWQCAARPSIEEKHIQGSGTKLSDIDTLLWKSMINEALDCLDKNKNYQGRAKQLVTLKSTGKSLEKEVSPHLRIYTEIDSHLPRDLQDFLKHLELARKRLQPIYNFISERNK